MGLKVSEYLGQRTDVGSQILPHFEEETPPCPFMSSKCTKIAKGYKPICSVRRNETIWMVCEHRLCSSSGGTGQNINDYQKGILLQVAKEIFNIEIESGNVIYKKEVSLPIVNTASIYKADFILSTYGRSRPERSVAPIHLIVEMQGGGETSNTGIITNHITKWENNEERTNNLLSSELSGPGVIQTNAWRRQQEQVLVKGHIATQTGYGIVLSTGTMLYDYIKGKLDDFSSFTDLRDARWDFALLAFKEDKSDTPVSGPIPFVIDEDRQLFTSFHAFSTALTTQGGPLPKAFKGLFTTLEGNLVNIE